MVGKRSFLSMQRLENDTVTLGKRLHTNALQHDVMIRYFYGQYNNSLTGSLTQSYSEPPLCICHAFLFTFLVNWRSMSQCVTPTEGSILDLELSTLDISAEVEVTNSPQLDPGTSSNIKEDEAPMPTNNDFFPSVSSTPKKSTKPPKIIHCDHPQCGYKTPYPNNLKRHKQARHVQVEYTCHDCGKTYKGKYDLKVHLGAVHNGNGIICEDCGQQFHNRSTLFQHRRREHVGKLPFSCDKCEKSFHDKSNFISHMNAHVGIKQHSCSKCKAKFAYIQSLKVHEKSCHGDEKYTCSVCSVSMSRQDILNDHIRSKHEGKIFRCGCGKEFSWRSSLGRHQKTCTFST